MTSLANSIGSSIVFWDDRIEKNLLYRNATPYCILFENTVHYKESVMCNGKIII